MKTTRLTYNILFLLLPFLVQSQELKKKIKTLNSFTMEEYHVLKNDKKIKHGPCQKSTKGNKIVEEGFYKMGKRDSVWKISHGGKLHKMGSYKEDQLDGTWITYGKMVNGQALLRDSGAYKIGNKIGLWKYTDREGQVDLIYDYDHKAILYQKQDSLEHFIISGKDTLSVKLERSPVYSEGWDQFYYTIAINSRLPKSFLQNPAGYKTKVYLSFFVDEMGNMVEVKAISHTDKELNQYAKAALEATRKSNWFPGIYQGKPVKTQVIIPFDFSHSGIFRM